MPKVATVVKGAPSMMVAAGMPHMNTVCWLVTVSGTGAAPKAQVHTAVLTTGFAMDTLLL